MVTYIRILAFTSPQPQSKSGFNAWFAVSISAVLILLPDHDEYFWRSNTAIPLKLLHSKVDLPVT